MSPRPLRARAKSAEVGPGPLAPSLDPVCSCDSCFSASLPPDIRARLGHCWPGPATTPCPHPGPKVTPRWVTCPSAPPPPDSSPPPARRLLCAPSHESWVQPSGLLTVRALVRNPILFYFFVMSQTGIDQSRGTLILGLIDRHGHTTHRCTNPTNTEKKRLYRTRESLGIEIISTNSPNEGQGGGGRREDTFNNTPCKGHFFFFFAEIQRVHRKTIEKVARP